MGVPTIKTGPMTVEEYFAFTDTRPDNEKWELIDGEPILNAPPSRLHQIILDNLVFLLGTIRHLRSLGDSLELPALGISLPLSEIYRDTGLK